MTSKQAPNDEWPLPLVAKKGKLGEVVRAYARDTSDNSGEPANFASVMARVGRRPRRVRAMALGLTVAALATAAVFLVVGNRQKAASASRVLASQALVPPLASPVAETPVPTRAADRSQPARAVPSLRLGDQPAALPTGESNLVGQATVVLASEAAAKGRTRAGATEIALQRGSIGLHVLPQGPGQRLVVVAGQHRFTVVGTAFNVLRTQGRVELQVQEGAVAVSRGAHRLAVVRAGGHWNSDDPRAPSAFAPPSPAAPVAAPRVPSQPAASLLEPSAEVARPPTPPPAPAQAPAAVKPVPPDCRQMVAAHRTQEAVACYQEQATRNGLAGETAAYELARLWRDSLGQPERALAAFEAQRSRFPAGALRREADLSIIELLPRLGRHAEALAETQRFLSAHPGDERKGEIHLLRGNIYREALRDLSHAQLEYALGAVAEGRAGDDSRFFQAVCLEALGKIEEARTVYQACLRQRGGAHTAEARERLSRLAP
jgi:tetratricopeptide (TPR) repeat protein